MNSFALDNFVIVVRVLFLLARSSLNVHYPLYFELYVTLTLTSDL
jgi:hypothetical protein